MITDDTEKNNISSLPEAWGLKVMHSIFAVPALDQR